jgi:hypothetical protein
VSSWALLSPSSAILAASLAQDGSKMPPIGLNMDPSRPKINQDDLRWSQDAPEITLDGPYKGLHGALSCFHAAPKADGIWIPFSDTLAPLAPPPPLLVLRRLSRALFFKMIDFRALLGFVLGLFWGCLGSSFARQHFLWAISGCLGPFLKPLGPFFGHLGHLLGCLGPSPTSPGACLGPS